MSSESADELDAIAAAVARLVTASNNVFWDDQPIDLDVPVFVAACKAANFVAAGYNLVNDPGNCAFDGPGDMIGADPLLVAIVSDQCAEPLLDGSCPPVWTIDTASPALDQGSCIISGVAEDARGGARPYDETSTAADDDGCDVGAYEYDGPSAPPPPVCEDCDDGR